MANNKQPQIGFTDWLRVGMIRISRIHFLLLAAYAVIIIAYDAAHVITPSFVMQRWIAGGLLLGSVAVIWYLAHNKRNDIAAYKRLIFMLVASDIAFAAFNVYTQRGMASRAVVLFLLPIIVSAVLLSRAAIIATAALSAAAYIVTSVMYFTLNFNEGYKSELYGEVGFYCAVFFIVALVLSTIVRFGGETNDS